jgi:hypothetical protein
VIRALAIGVVITMTAHARARAVVCFGGPLPARPVIGQKPRIAGSGGMIVTGDQLPDWRFRKINETVRPHVVTLAPGLAIYHPPPLPGDIVELENTDRQLIARARRAFTVEPPLAPPTVSKVVANITGRYGYVTASIAGTVPESARVAIISRVERTRTVPLSWALVNPGQTDVLIWRARYSCDHYVSTWVQPKVGERVVLTWVDDAGRVSEPSKPLTISGPPRGK